MFKISESIQKNQCTNCSFEKLCLEGKQVQVSNRWYYRRSSDHHGDGGFSPCIIGDRCEDFRDKNYLEVVCRKCGEHRLVRRSEYDFDRDRYCEGCREIIRIKMLSRPRCHWDGSYTCPCGYTGQCRYYQDVMQFPGITVEELAGKMMEEELLKEKEAV